MTWAEFAAARQLLTEEFVGRRLREAQAQEDAQVAATRKAIEKATNAR